MSSASSHPEVISRKPSGSCLIHPSISSSSSDYDEGEEFNLLGESLKQPHPEDLLVRPTRPLCPGVLDSNLFPPKRKVYYTFEDGPVFLVYPVHSFLCIFFVLFPDVQLSSISLPTSRLRSLSRFKSKSKSNRHLSSNAFSRSFSLHQRQHQPHHHECLPQDSESLCVRPNRQTPSFRPTSHLKTVNNLKLNHLESKSRSRHQVLVAWSHQYLIQVFCRISAFPIDVVEYCHPHIVHHSLFCISSS